MVQQWISCVLSVLQFIHISHRNIDIGAPLQQIYHSLNTVPH